MVQLVASRDYKRHAAYEQLVESKIGLIKMSPKEEENKYTINLTPRYSDSEWSRIIENFALKATPTWFSWIGWLFALSGLNYLYKQSKSILIGIILSISMYMLWEYFLAFFYRIEFKGFPFIKNDRIALFASIVLSTLLGYGFWQTARIIVAIVTTHKP